MMKRLALFDCDGTLVDSQANICIAMEHAFDSASLSPPPRSAIRQIVGLSLYETMRALLPDADEALHRNMVEQYRASYLLMRQNGLEDEPLYDGIAGVLKGLETQGWALGVATGKSDRGLERCLDHHAIRDMFVTLQTADRHPSKPHPSMIYQAMDDAGASAENTVMIGDTVYDIHMAVAAGCRSVGVSWGYHSVADLRDAGADVIVEAMDELSAFLKDMQ
jgi:phosphoglycolate phosphatase